MNITQAYFLAHKARNKLALEAAQPDHNLRLLVGHANMLDSLMLDLAKAEEEQERWYNNIVNVSPSVEEVKQEEKTPEEAEDKSESEVEITAVEMDSSIGNDEEELVLTRTTSRHARPEMSLDPESSDPEEGQHMPQSPPSLDSIVLEVAIAAL